MSRTVIFTFYRKRHWIGQLISHYSGGPWTHTATTFVGALKGQDLMDTNITIESLGGRLLGTNGVVASVDDETYHQGKQKSKRIERIALTVSEDAFERAFTFARNQIGMAYDYKGVLGFVIRLLGAGPKNKWYCSELSAKVFEIITSKPVSTKRQSPSSLYDIVDSAKRAMYGAPESPI